jgi:hypothetical protein
VYLFGAALLASMLSVVSSTGVLAASGQVQEVLVSSPVQTIEAGTRSEVIKITFTRADTVLPLPSSAEGKVTAQSTSATGRFYEVKDSTEPLTDNTREVAAGVESVELYYEDSSVGEYELTFTYTPNFDGTELSAKQNIQIKAKEVVVSEPKLELQPFSAPHTDRNAPITVFGAIAHVPEGAEVTLELINAAGEVRASQSVGVREVNGKLADISLPKDIANGTYTVRLSAKASVEDVLPVDTPLTITLTPLSLPLTPTSPPLVEPEKPVISKPPLKTLESATPTLSTAFSTPRTLASARSEAFVAAASQKTPKSAISAQSMGATEDSEVLGTEKTISLKGDPEEPVLEATEEGWKVMGAPWYWWGVGGTAMYGGWFGLRRWLQSGE